MSASSSETASYPEWYTSVDRVADIVKDVRQAWDAGLSKSESWRRQQLCALLALIRENRQQILDALHSDLRQSPFLASVAEVDGIVDEIKLALASLGEWMSERQVDLPPVQQPASGYVKPTARGVVLIMSPWNYPLRLALLPLVGALAAGNCVVLKPSEVSGASARLIGELVPLYLDGDCVRVVNGDVPVCTALLAERFDYCFFTGGGSIGKIVMRACAEHLTPLTLELGGKSPAIVADDANLEVTARRIVWGKFGANNGQTCVAPDYMLVVEPLKAALVVALRSAIVEFFGDDAQQTPDYSRIINERHFDRIVALLPDDKSKVAHGGAYDRDDLFLEPTIVVDPALDSELMRSEIFGPVLPVIGVASVGDAIRFVRERDTPLALYAFTESKSVADRIVDATESGGVCINDTVMHIAVPSLPFGGKGPSGMGAYNGRASFDTFSHNKSVLHKVTWLDPSIRYPPYTQSKIDWFVRLNSIRMPSASSIARVGLAAAAVAASYWLYNRRDRVQRAIDAFNKQ
jgi:aldehyde dehydrogenase (NAD+)